MSTDRTLARIDATLDDYDQWDGHSPDAARWAGGPNEGEWQSGEPNRDQPPEHMWIEPPDNSERAREWADEVNRQLAWRPRSFQ